MTGKGRYPVWATTCAVLVAGAVLACAPAQAGTFGRVISIGGHAADLALDEPRGVLYVANFTANRIEVVSLADYSIQTSINVSAQPGSLALSPDGRFLVIGHYGNFAAPNTSTNGLTVIDLNTRGRQTFAMGAPVLGVAFGNDGNALVVTNIDFELFDPVSGTTQVIDTVTGLTARTLPVPGGNAPPAIVACSIGASVDGRVIYGLSETFNFRYEVERKALKLHAYTSSPTMGPRAVSVNRDGSSYISGWVLRNAAGTNVAQFGDVNGALDVGGHAFDIVRGVIYTQIPTATGGPLSGQPPTMWVVDSDSLAIKERLNLAENLAGKAVFDRAYSTAYAISASGITVLPVSQLDQAPKVVATQEDVIFRGNFCDRRVSSQEIGIISPGGAPVDFTLSTTAPGIRISPSSGVTPATVRISVDPTAYQNLKGTQTALIDVKSSAAINIAPQIRVLVNNREPDQRGTVVNVPGKLVDLVADPTRDRFYILRQDTNEVQVYDGGNYSLIAKLKTGNTPTQMAITFDRRYMLVGNENSHVATLIDLETLEGLGHIAFPIGHYPRSIASSGKALLASTRVAGAIHTIDRIDIATRTATQLPSLGVFANDIDKTTVLAASPNGSKIFVVQNLGTVMVYDANSDTFTISRKITRESERLTGAFAASSFDQFVVGNRVLNSSLVQVASLDSGAAVPSGFFFVDQTGLRTSAVDSSSAGVIERVDASGAVAQRIRSTRMAEAPYLGTVDFPLTRTLAPLYSRNVIINLTTSGFTVLPWNYDASVPAPRIERVTNAADSGPAIATGGLISIFGQNLSPVNAVSRELPLPTALGESCLTVNGIPTPMMFVSPTQINAQVPFLVDGNVTMILRTPGGVSDNFNLLVRPTAPSIFRAPENPAVATVVRDRNGEMVTLSNPIHRNEPITVLLTGLGRTNPPIDAGVPAPSNPLLPVLNEVKVTLGDYELPQGFAGLAPGQVGVYKIELHVPGDAPLGTSVPLTVRTATGSTQVNVRVVN